MNNQFIQGVSINRNKLPTDSYIREIEAFRGMEYLEFDKPVTFFVEKTEAENQLC